MGFFKRAASAAADTAALGTGALALPVHSGTLVPPACVGVAFDKGGRARRFAPGQRIALEAHENACCFHPGPYSADLVPFALAPELGLRLTFAIDAPDPRVRQQRFDLYLASEGATGVSTAAMVDAMQSALQRELAQGNLELPPCTSLAEWNSFRAAFNQLLYTRFGVTVEDCIPADLGEQVDYAQMLRARAASAGPMTAGPVANAAAGALSDAQALRRLFLELPCVTAALRMVVLPPGQGLFGQHQALLQRFDRASLLVATMPALELAAPGQALPAEHQQRRTLASVAAVAALDEAWALLARLALSAGPPLFDDADRIAANLELQLAARRIAIPESESA
jgi:hypothetical protein